MSVALPPDAGAEHSAVMPDDDRAAVLPLESLYLHLVRTGFPLSARDYADALRAIRAGHGVGGRERLHALLRTLWARGDEETVRLDAVFRRFQPPTSEQVRSLTGEAARSAGLPLPAGEDGLGAVAPAGSKDGAEPGDGDRTGLPEFAAGTEAGFGLPSVAGVRRPSRPYVFAPRPPLAERALVVAWRRLKRTQRLGPAVELDIDATVEHQCRNGWMLHPVLVPARLNQAKLLVLMDASPSMRPWRRLDEPLAESLRQGRLARGRLLFFDNDPREGLYETSQLGGRHACDTTLREHAAALLLVIGDAGTARARSGRGDRSRAAGTRDFLSRARAFCPSIAWLNPMPAGRWGPAEYMVRPAAAMFEASEEGVTRAIDHLRGQRLG